MRSLCQLCFLTFVSMVAACTVPVRTGYDRTIGDYESPDSVQGAGSASADSLLSEPEDSMPEDLAAWMKVIKPWLGTRYEYGHSSRSGTDCSGYVMQIFKEKTGKSLPHSSGKMFKMGDPVDVEDLKPGDLVFFGSHWGIDHVGLYLSNGNFTHASTSNGVEIAPLSAKYWKDRYRGARRIL